MKILIRFNIDALRRKISRAKSELPKQAEKALRQLADDALDQIDGLGRSERESAIRRSLKRQFDAVFEEVQLKHQRPEKWPDLMPIYRARVLNHQRTFQGRRRFYVDEHKADALFDQLLARAMAHNPRDQYQVRFTVTARGYARVYRIDIIKRGRNQHAPAVVLSYVNTMLPSVASQVIRDTLREVKLLR